MSNAVTYKVEQNANSKKWRVVKLTGASMVRLSGAFATREEAEAKASALAKGGR